MSIFLQHFEFQWNSFPLKGRNCLIQKRNNCNKMQLNAVSTKIHPNIVLISTYYCLLVFTFMRCEISCRKCAIMHSVQSTKNNKKKAKTIDAHLTIPSSIWMPVHWMHQLIDHHFRVCVCVYCHVMERAGFLWNEIYFRFAHALSDPKILFNSCFFQHFLFLSFLAYSPFVSIEVLSLVSNLLFNAWIEWHRFCARCEKNIYDKT